MSGIRPLTNNVNNELLVVVDENVTPVPLKFVLEASNSYPLLPATVPYVTVALVIKTEPNATDPGAPPGFVTVDPNVM